jgi:hypothetical protein
VGLQHGGFRLVGAAWPQPLKLYHRASEAAAAAVTVAVLAVAAADNSALGCTGWCTHRQLTPAHNSKQALQQLAFTCTCRPAACTNARNSTTAAQGQGGASVNLAAVRPNL